MSMRFLISAVFAMTLLASPGWVVPAIVPNEAPPLRLTLATLPNVNYTVSRIPLKVTFQNISEKEVRILSAFKKPQLVPIFFRLSVRASDGTPMPAGGGGKVSLRKESYQYIVLKKGQKTDMIIDVAQFLSGTQLKAGTYDFSLSYYNQYGSDCFQGTLESNTVKINLAD